MSSDAARELGRLGGKKKTPAQTEARRKNMQKAREGRMKRNKQPRTEKGRKEQ